MRKKEKELRYKKNKENLNYKKGDWTQKVPKIQKQTKKTSSLIKGVRLLVTTE